MTYSASAVWQGQEVIPAPSIKASSCADDAGGRKAKGSISSPKTLQQRKRFTSVLPVAESYLPKYYPATELAAIQAETLERPRALVEPENELSYCQRLPAAAQTAGTAGNPRRWRRRTADWPYPATRGAVCLGLCQLSSPCPWSMLAGHAWMAASQQSIGAGLSPGRIGNEGTAPHYREYAAPRPAQSADVVSCSLRNICRTMFDA